MTATKEVTIWCDHLECVRWEALGESRVPRARHAVMLMGWVFRNKRDLCPNHKSSVDAVVGEETP